MSSLSKLAKAQLVKPPEVVAMVATDRNGVILDITGDVDGETVGPVHAVGALALGRAGEALGLGALVRVAITGPKRACVIALQEEEIVGFFVDPSKPLAAFEKKLDGVLRQ
jgi:hypothetical protein